ncbi:MAG: polysaccharide deacetylase family protein [Armatimonadetes bacterium]|nr:polysaccharide deacetylase family protein [Armatimonadota bacterium]
MIALVLWFALGLLVTGLAVFVASHYLRLTLRSLAVIALGTYAAGFIGLSLMSDGTRALFLGRLAWMFSASVPMGTAWKPLLACWVAFGLVIRYFIPTYEANGLGNSQGTIRKLLFPFRAVALTFDDGPSPDWTPRVLDVLKKNQVKGTFFMVGKSVEQHPDLVRRIVAEGHVVGSHSFSHRCMPLLDQKSLEEEIDRAAEAIEKVTGQKPRYFRPPWGMYNRAVLDALRKRGYLTVLWTRSSQDWRNPGADVVHALSTQNPELGEIVLFHDGGNYPSSLGMSREQTVDSLTPIIETYERQGYQVKTIEEMVTAWLS